MNLSETPIIIRSMSAYKEEIVLRGHSYNTIPGDFLGILSVTLDRNKSTSAKSRKLTLVFHDSKRWRDLTTSYS